MTIGNTTIDVPVVKTIDNFTHNGLDPIVHNLTVVYDGDGYYNSAEENVAFIIKSVIVNLIKVTVSNVVIIIVLENVNANITTLIDNKIIEDIINEAVGVPIKDMQLKNHDLTVFYKRNQFTNFNNISSTFIVREDIVDLYVSLKGHDFIILNSSDLNGLTQTTIDFKAFIGNLSD